MVSVPLDVLKQYFGDFLKIGPVASAQFLYASMVLSPPLASDALRILGKH